MGDLRNGGGDPSNRGGMILKWWLDIPLRTMREKSNYRPVSILPLLSKPFERVLCEQINSHTKDILSNIREDFEKIQLPIFITSNVRKMQKITR